VRDLDRIQEVSEYRVTGPQLGTLLVLICVLVGGAGLAGYQAGLMHGPVDEQLLNPSTGAAAGGSAVLADMLAEREQGTKKAGEGIEGVPPRMGAPELGSSLTNPDPDLAVVPPVGEPTEVEGGHGESATASTPSAPESEAGGTETEAPTSAPEATIAAHEPQPDKATPPSESVADAGSSSQEASSGASRPSSAAPDGRGFTIQLAAYPSPKEADELVASLRAAGFDEAFYQVAKVNSRTWYRVRVGLYGSRPEAESAAGRLAGVSPYDPYITTHP